MYFFTELNGTVMSNIPYNPELADTDSAIYQNYSAGFKKAVSEYFYIFVGPTSVAQLDPTGDQEVAGSTPAKVGNILSLTLIMKYFLQSFSPLR